MAVDAAVSPQLTPPCLFVSWAQVAGGLGLPITHHDTDDFPLAELEEALTCFFPNEKERFLLTNRTLFHRLPKQAMPLEAIAQEVLEAIYRRRQSEWSWSTLLWEVAKRKQYWLDASTLPLPEVIQINCGGLGGNSGSV